MRLTVCQLANETLDRDWPSLVAHAADSGSDLVLLPEMIFSPWHCASEEVTPAVWSESVAEHEDRLSALSDLLPATVIASMPTLDGGMRRHDAIVRRPDGPIERVHQKYYLPDEPGFYEASWYERGDGQFETFSTAGAIVGMAMCTEIWFSEHARSYAKAGIEIIASPRCTEPGSLDAWLAAGRVSAIVSGAFSISSNRAGSHQGVEFGGMGWVTDPDGKVLATTIEDEPFVTVDVDLASAKAAKSTYPRYVAE